MDPSLLFSSPSDFLTFETDLITHLGDIPLSGVCLVMGPGTVGRATTAAMGRLLGEGAVSSLPSAHGTHEVAGHLFIRVGGEAGDFAAAGARAARRLHGDTTTQVVLAAAHRAQAREFAVALVRSAQSVGPTGHPRVLRVWCQSPAQEVAVREGARLGARILWARRMANTPSNVKTPGWLADRARGLSQPGTSTRVGDARWLRTERFGGVLAVGAGSAHPPNVTVIDHDPSPGEGSDRRPHVTLVGKGITFDSGGLMLKRGSSMSMMKTDMAAAAAVIATVAAVQDLGLPMRLTAVIACAENMPSGSAMRPGDVVRHRGGRTTEVLNTDAEGRLVLADCLAYSAQRLQPDYLVDLATLTGSVTLGLGRQHAALYTDDDRLAADLTAAGIRSGDRVWRMPLVPDYEQAITSDVADAANTNTEEHIGAGSITAALFLRPFAGSTRWAHLDIAGAGRTESDFPDCRKGASGFGVSLLTHWLAGLCGRRL